MNLLHVEHLTKRFTLHHLGGKSIHGFTDLSFSVSPGQVLALSGPSGSGKSSVLRCIYRTYLPTAGRILYASENHGPLDLAVLPEHHIIRLRRREIGYVSQFLNVLPRVAAADVVAEPLIRCGAPVRQARDQAKSLLDRLHIPCPLHDAYPVTFSGGEQQRVNIARAVISRPRLLLLDEPTASLDAHASRIVLDLMDMLRRAGTGIIMICHDQKVVKKMADTIIQMSAEAPAVTRRSTDGNPEQNRDMIIANGNLVLPDDIAGNTDLVICDGRIRHIGPCPDSLRHLPRVDADGLWVLPGFIDLHSDAIEKAIQPRPRARLPMEIALTELDKNLAACGITTMHHCISFTTREDNELRYYKRAAELVRRIKELAPRMLVSTRVHARYEMLETEAIGSLARLMADGLLDLVSLMDHTPGQGQFRNKDYLYEYYTKASHMSRQQVDDMVERRVALKGRFDDGHVRELVRQCAIQSIPVASHDDDTAAKVAWVNDLGVRISEFPVTLEAAQAAKELGMSVLMGAPNIIFGRSLSDNLSGRDAIAAHCCNLIGSDYSPSSLLHAVFKLHQLNIGTLPELIGMVTRQPARIIGEQGRKGAIAPGLEADIVLVDPRGHAPRVIQTFVAGRQVYSGR